MCVHSPTPGLPQRPLAEKWASPPTHIYHFWPVPGHLKWVKSAILNLRFDSYSDRRPICAQHPDPPCHWGLPKIAASQLCFHAIEIQPFQGILRIGMQTGLHFSVCSQSDAVALPAKMGAHRADKANIAPVRQAGGRVWQHRHLWQPVPLPAEPPKPL